MFRCVRKTFDAYDVAKVTFMSSDGADYDQFVLTMTHQEADAYQISSDYELRLEKVS